MTCEAIDIHVLAERSRENVERALTMTEVSAQALVEPIAPLMYGQRGNGVWRHWPSIREAVEDALSDTALGFSLYIGPMVGFTTDGFLTIGLTVDLDYSPYELDDVPLSQPDRARVQDDLVNLASRFEARLGVAAWETPPPESEREMRLLMASAVAAYERID